MHRQQQIDSITTRLDWAQSLDDLIAANVFAVTPTWMSCQWRLAKAHNTPPHFTPYTTVRWLQHGPDTNTDSFVRTFWWHCKLFGSVWHVSSVRLSKWVVIQAAHVLTPINIHRQMRQSMPLVRTTVRQQTPPEHWKATSTSGSKVELKDKIWQN